MFGIELMILYFDYVLNIHVWVNVKIRRNKKKKKKNHGQAQTNRPGQESDQSILPFKLCRAGPTFEKLVQFGLGQFWVKLEETDPCPPLGKRLPVLYTRK